MALYRDKHGSEIRQNRGKSNDQLAAMLAERVMGWRVGPDRFTLGSREWMPRWRFQPADKLEDAFKVLEGAAPDEYSIWGDNNGTVHARVRVGGTVGEAHGTSKPLVIASAVARAMGVEVEP